jgi:predicted nucleic acid-binding protein
MIVVTNSGPLIALARIGRLELLHALFGKLCVPPAVREEVVASGHGRPGAKEIGAADWVETVHVRDRTAVQLLHDRLAMGESQALVLAIEMKADLLLMDEARGRRIAEARGLNVSGTIGVLVAAKRRRLIPAVTPVLDQLLAAGFRMSEDLYQTGQRLANEI